MTGSDKAFRHFHDELRTLEQRLLDMSARAEESLDRAIDALVSRDTELAAAVVSADAEIDRFEIEVERLAVDLLALQQPMARDLRFIVAAIRISSDLERVGDHAVNIAQATLRLAESDASGFAGPLAEVAYMARRAGSMLNDAIGAFVRADGLTGRAVCAADDEVDALHESLFRVLLTHMMENPTTISASLQFLLVGRNLERVADLATNIGEDAVFVAEGKQIKHHIEDRATPPPVTEA